MQLEIHPFDMPLRYPFAISRHTYFSQPNVICALHYRGQTGYGEATINPYYHITIDNLKETFTDMANRLSGYQFETPDQLFMDFSDYLAKNSFALAALNNASWDLYGKLLQRPVSTLIDLPAQSPPMTSYTLGIASQEEMAQKIADFPWPIYKIKLGTTDDLKLIRQLRDHTSSTLRVDANCAWSAQQTLRLSAELSRLGVEFIEQPLSAGDPEQQDCFEQSKLPLIADESCCVETDIEKCHGIFHGINIKLLKCGGLTPAIRMIRKARHLALQVMVGCMTETTVGISAATQLLPFVDFADLDGPLLLADDLASGLTYSAGKIIGTQGHGFGIIFKS